MGGIIARPANGDQRTATSERRPATSDQRPATSDQKENLADKASVRNPQALWSTGKSACVARKKRGLDVDRGAGYR